MLSILSSHARLQVFARACELLRVRMQLFARGWKSSQENASLRARMKAFSRELVQDFVRAGEILRTKINIGVLFLRKKQGLVRLVEKKFGSWFWIPFWFSYPPSSVQMFIGV